MPEHRISRRKGEGIRVDGPATIRVGRRVRLAIELAPGTRLRRVPAKAALTRRGMPEIPPLHHQTRRRRSPTNAPETDSTTCTPRPDRPPGAPQRG